MSVAAFCYVKLKESSEQELENNHLNAAFALILKIPSPFLKPQNIQRNTLEANASMQLGKASRLFDNPFKIRPRKKTFQFHFS